jgi:hypothetical protein
MRWPRRIIAVPPFPTAALFLSADAVGRRRPGKRVEQKAGEVLDHAGVEAVLNELAFALAEDEVGVFQNAQVKGERVGGHVEFIGQRTRMEGPLAQGVEDPAAGGIGKGLERLVETEHGHPFNISTTVELL